MTLGLPVYVDQKILHLLSLQRIAMPSERSYNRHPITF
jgi:hypothetical protein